MSETPALSLIPLSSALVPPRTPVIRHTLVSISVFVLFARIVYHVCVRSRDFHFVSALARITGVEDLIVRALLFANMTLTLAFFRVPPLIHGALFSTDGGSGQNSRDSSFILRNILTVSQD